MEYVLIEMQENLAMIESFAVFSLHSTLPAAAL
jgi:hypothetical protein